MAKFNVVIKASAEKELEKLPNVAVAEILTVIYSLAENPYQNGIKKLKGKSKKSPCFRIRAGNYRMTFFYKKYIKEYKRMLNIRA